MKTMKDLKLLKSWDLLVLGLIICCAVFYYAARVNYDFIDTTGDNYSYDLIAQSVFTAHPFKVNVKFDYYDDHPIFHHQRSFPPLYPIMLAIFQAVLGQSMYINILASCLFAILSAFPVFFLGKLIGNSRCGLLSALLTVFSFTLVDTSLLSMSESLFTLLSISSLYFFVSYECRKKKKLLLLAGVFSGLAYLTRTNGAATIAAFTFYLLIKEGEPFKRANIRKKANELLLYLGSALLIALPWLIRNYLIFGDPFYYVGRFFAGLKPGGLYSGVYEQAPTIGRFLSSSSLKEIFNRYAVSFDKHLKLIWKEMSLVSLVAVISLFKPLKSRSANLIIGLYILFNILISLLHPSTYSRHIINIFPALFLLASLLMTASDWKSSGMGKTSLKLFLRCFSHSSFSPAPSKPYIPG